MKQHSYAFYVNFGGYSFMTNHSNYVQNGHLSEEYKIREILRRKLKQLENIASVATPSATTPQISSLSTSYLDHEPTASDLNQRRQYQRRSSLDDGSSNVAQVAAAIESGEPLDIDQ